VLLTLTGAVLLRLAFSDAYLRYVNEWMKWPLVACGVVLLALAVTHFLAPAGDSDHEEEGDSHGAHVPHAAWLLFVPSLVVFLIAPPALGSYLAERSDSGTAAPTEGQMQAAVAPLTDKDPAPVTVAEFFVRARYDQGRTLVDRRVRMSGFVSLDDEGNWYVSRFGISCCAADASVTRIQVAGGPPAPERDQWVEVVGTWVQGSGVESGPPEIEVSSVEEIEPPRMQYE
jgi:uncharacterized repeat protein (TIGR03943 family)